MRIIAGQRRGHKIASEPGRDVRPTSDLVREAIFNILRESIEGRSVIDLFAGTGALGLEALSRGASRALFVERRRETAALIRRNLGTLRYEDRGAVLLADAYRWVRSFRPLDEAPVVVFVDPPYRDHESRARPVRPLLANLVSRLPVGSIVIVESGRELDELDLPDADAWDRRRYGNTRVALRTIEQPPDQPGAADAGPDTDPDAS
jgi:16S rRNA (guanine966-N2)-methyltransferase